jgi:hypothetical protein
MKTLSLSPPTPPLARLIVAASLCALSAAAAAQTPGTASRPAPAAAEGAAQVASGTARPTPAGGYREIKWDDLVPQGWDPMKDFKSSNLSLLKDGDPRANDMLKRMREAWDNAPTNADLEGTAVRIPGYVVPLDDAKSGMREFLLVPYFGACIHTPPPPANQIILVQPQKPAKGYRSMDTVWVSGTIRSLHSDSPMGASGYRMESALVEPYTGPRK